MASKKTKKMRERERLAAELAARQRKKRRTRFAAIGTAAVVVVLLATVVTWAAVSRDGEDTATAKPSAGTGTPPWPLPDDPLAGARAAGLDVSEMEGTANHFHSHLDIVVDGEQVDVPGNIGVASSAMSELHTHDPDGTLHVEAPTPNKRYHLWQLFRTWQVRLTKDAIGGLEAGDGKTLRGYVDGKRVEGNPAKIELKDKQQIVLVYGPADEKPDLPTYTFPPDS